MRPHGYGLGKPHLDTKKQTYGAYTKIIVEKNVIGNPRQYVEKPPVLIRFGTGIDLADDALEMGLEMGLVEYRKPSYYWPNGERIATGRQRAVEYLNDVDPQARDELRAEISRRIQERAKSGAAFDALSKFMRANVRGDGECAPYTVDEERVLLWKQGQGIEGDVIIIDDPDAIDGQVIERLA